MSDFLHNLRTGNIKRYDRPRKSYDNPQYRHPQDRQYNKDRKGKQAEKLQKQKEQAEADHKNFRVEARDALRKLFNMHHFIDG